jgi:hypothetical protein
VLGEIAYLIAMLSFLQQPFPQETDLRTYLLHALAISGAVSFVLVAFQPFGLDTLPGHRGVWVGLGFGGITLLVKTLNYGWLRLLPYWFIEPNWTLGKELIWASYSFLTIATGNFLGGGLMLPEASLFQHFGETLLITVLVGLLPYLLMVYVSHTRYLKRYLREARQLESGLASHSGEAVISHDPEVSFTDETGLLPPIRRSEWLFIEAEGNYLRLWVRQNGELTDFRLRGTIKGMSERLAHEVNCFQCHRAFLVNLANVQHVEGNSAGYRLTMDPGLAAVPVSRSKTQAFREVMEAKTA